MKPILFNTAMVQAILDGRKTQTRRVCKALENYDFSWGLDRKPYIGDYKTFTKVAPRKWDNVTLENVWLYDLQTAVDESKTYVLKPSYQPGDILWVRETWSKKDGHYFYKAGHELLIDSEPLIKRWHPSIHMPREAARIFLRVTNVRMERLQEISYDDCLREGLWNYGTDVDTLGAFQQLWNGTVKKSDLDTYGWNANPWVWVYEFERVSEDV